MLPALRCLQRRLLTLLGERGMRALFGRTAGRLNAVASFPECFATSVPATLLCPCLAEDFPLLFCCHPLASWNLPILKEIWRLRVRLRQWEFLLFFPTRHLTRWSKLLA